MTPDHFPGRRNDRFWIGMMLLSCNGGVSDDAGTGLSTYEGKGPSLFPVGACLMSYALSLEAN